MRPKSFSILNASFVVHILQRNGADFCLYINTGIEYDCSDTGAPPDEAVSWGKVRPNVTPVKVFSDASIVLPILVAQTFAKAQERYAALYDKKRPWKGDKLLWVVFKRKTHKYTVYVQTYIVMVLHDIKLNSYKQL